MHFKRITMLSSVLVVTLGFPLQVLATTPKDQTPILHAYQQENQAKLEWAVEMLDEDVLYQTGFEASDELPKLDYNSSGNREFGGQSFTTEDKYSGKSSLKVVDTYANGNYRNVDMFGNATYHIYSIAQFLDRKHMDNGTNLSATFRAKTTGKANVSLTGIGGRADYGQPLNVTFTENVKTGDRTAKVSDPSFFKSYVDRGSQYYLANKKGAYTGYVYVTSVDMNTSTIRLSGAFQGGFNKGDAVLKHNHRNPVRFTAREFTNKDGWNLFSINTKVSDLKDYNTLERGFGLWINTQSRDTVFIDDLKLGYATRTQLFKGNQLLYDGYLSDYTDTQAIDKVKPEAVSNYNVELSNGKSYVVFEQPKDTGNRYAYTVKAIAHNETVYDSKREEIDIISGVAGYSYVIDNKPNTIPNGEINATSNRIEIPTNQKTKTYFHIAAVDGAGNVSDTKHYLVNNGLSLLHVEASTDTWTNQSVTLYVTGVDTDRIILPNGVVVVGNSAAFTASENGVYTFQALDSDGKWMDIISYAVQNIDREGKDVRLTPDDANWKNKDVEVRIEAMD